MDTRIPNIILNVLKDVYRNYDATAGIYSHRVVSRQNIWRIYQIRYNIVADKQALDVKYLKLWQTAVEQLHIFPAEEVTLHSFRFEDERGVIVFSDVEHKTLIGYIPLNKVSPSQIQ